MRKKEIYAQVVLFLPFGVAIGAYLILPFLYEGMRDLLSFVEMARYETAVTKGARKTGKVG